MIKHETTEMKFKDVLCFFFNFFITHQIKIKNKKTSIQYFSFLLLFIVSSTRLQSRVEKKNSSRYVIYAIYLISIYLTRDLSDIQHTSLTSDTKEKENEAKQGINAEVRASVMRESKAMNKMDGSEKAGDK